MKRLGKIVGVVLAGVGLLFGVAYVLGARLPVDHHVELERVVDSSMAETWARVRDVEHAASWRTALESVSRVEDPEGRERYRETSSFGPLDYVVQEETAGSRLVTRIVDQEDFGGTWTIELWPAEAGHTKVRLREDGEVPNALFRFFSHYVFGEDTTARAYLDDLERACAGESSGSANGP